MCVRLDNASWAFACLRPSIFYNKQLSRAIKREVYPAVVLLALLYGTQTWTMKVDTGRRMMGLPQSLH